MAVISCCRHHHWVACGRFFHRDVECNDVGLKILCTLKRTTASGNELDNVNSMTALSDWQGKGNPRGKMMTCACLSGEMVRTLCRWINTPLQEDVSVHVRCCHCTKGGTVSVALLKVLLAPLEASAGVVVLVVQALWLQQCSWHLC